MYCQPSAPARNACHGIRARSLPTAVLEIDASPASGLREAHLDFCRRVPPGVVPAEDDSIWRLKFRHTANLELLAIGKPLVEPTARFRLQEDLVGARGSYNTKARRGKRRRNAGTAGRDGCREGGGGRADSSDPPGAEAGATKSPGPGPKGQGGPPA